MIKVSGLDELIEAYHRAARAFATGDPAPVKAIFSRHDDVMLANPFGPAVRGWPQVADALDQAASRFHDGDVTSFETLACYASHDLACTHELERWRAKVGGRSEITPFELRVTTTFRREPEGWKVVHRHADPIATPDEDGPLRPYAVAG